MRSPKDILWILIHGVRAGEYTTLLSQKEVDHVRALARNDQRKETEDEQDTKRKSR